MTITIRLKTDNAAFEPDRKAEEIERIIREWLDAVGPQPCPKLYDCNGNTVGSVTVSGR